MADHYRYQGGGVMKCPNCERTGDHFQKEAIVDVSDYPVLMSVTTLGSSHVVIVVGVERRGS